ncbi:MAG: phytanoyl-CoA dioxygenase family protein, partial [Aeoliella sp.]
YFQLVPPQVLTMWLALDKVDKENGALRYVKGSHCGGRRPHASTEVVGFSQGITDYGPRDVEAECLVTLSPGDLVVHHGETIHRADSNRSTDRQRRAFAMVFRAASCRVDEAARAEYQKAVEAQHARSGQVSNPN